MSGLFDGSFGEIDRRRRKEEAEAYLAKRTGTYGYRTRRYAAVCDELEARGLDNGKLLVDLGAGPGEFDYYLRTVRGFKGRYLPVDAVLDGTNLESWVPMTEVDYFIAVEVLEHLANWETVIKQVQRVCTGAIVITTPNTDMLGEAFVKQMDDTHIRPIHRAELEDLEFLVLELSLFGRDRDTLLGIWESSELRASRLHPEKSSRESWLENTQAAVAHIYDEITPEILPEDSFQRISGESP